MYMYVRYVLLLLLLIIYLYAPLAFLIVVAVLSFLTRRRESMAGVNMVLA